MKRSAAVHGFTLVELLMVIGIISLLVSLLLPALRHSIDTARFVVCTNNLKQLTLAFNSYGADYDTWMPRGSRSWQPMTTWGQAFFFNTYLEGNAKVDQGTGKISNHDEVSKSAPGQIYHCPSGQIQSSWPNFAWRISYVKNYQFMSVKLRTMSRTNTIAHLFEKDWVPDDAFLNYYETYIANALSKRHNYGGNILFFDMHVERVDFGYYHVNYPDYFNK
ncbi:MAG: type II secretion system protein [Planctomycetes bacterium]|nr:type II secretion system protein [Planctomycetota bacterium]